MTRTHGAARRYSTVLLDLDHTIFDFDASETAAFADALALIGIDDPDQHFPTYARLNTALWAAAERGEIRSAEIRNQRFELLLGELGLDADQATVALIADAFVHGLGAHGDLYPGARDVLGEIAQRTTVALVSNGLGEVVHAEAMMSYDLAGPFGGVILGDPDHWVHRLPGGLAQNNLSHPLSLVLSLLGDGPVTTRARGLRHRPQRFGDARDRFHDEVRIDLECGRATATIQFSCRVRPVQLSLVVYGSRSTAAVSLDARTVRTVRGSRLPGPFQKVDWARRDAAEAWRALARRAADLVGARLHYFEGMADLFRRFHAAALHGGADPVPLESARRVTAVMDEVFRACSAEERGWAAAEAIA